MTLIICSTILLSMSSLFHWRMTMFPSLRECSWLWWMDGIAIIYRKTKVWSKCGLKLFRELSMRRVPRSNRPRKRILSCSCICSLPRIRPQRILCVHYSLVTPKHLCNWTLIWWKSMIASTMRVTHFLSKMLPLIHLNSMAHRRWLMCLRVKRIMVLWTIKLSGSWKRSLPHSET